MENIIYYILYIMHCNIKYYIIYSVLYILYILK